MAYHVNQLFYDKCDIYIYAPNRILNDMSPHGDNGFRYSVFYNVINREAARMKVLIIDDSKSIQKSVAWRLAKLGLEVVGYGNDGDEGASLFKSLKPDLVLLDITMPNKDGRECLKEIIRENKTATVIMLSAVGNPEIVNECLEQGAKAFIDKNLLMSEGHLEGVIRKVLENLTAKSA